MAERQYRLGDGHVVAIFRDVHHERAVVGWIHADTDRGTNFQLVPVYVKRLRHRLQNFTRHLLRIVKSGMIFQQDDELVVVQTRNRIAMAQVAFQALRNHANQFVAYRMPQAIVDVFEAIQI